MQRIAIYPGTFDPITNGHVDIIQRASHLFDRLIVAVAATQRKQSLFSLDERVAMCREIFSAEKNIAVEGFSKRMVDFAHEHKVNYIVKGLRNVSDFDYEMQMANMNRRMASEIETIFLPASQQNAFVSATMVREIISLNGDASLFLHPIVVKWIERRKQ